MLIIYKPITVLAFSKSNLALEQPSKQCCHFIPSKKLTMAHANYTLTSGLNVHPVHVSRTDEEGNVTQERVWATVAQVADPFCVHARLDVDVLQPKFQGLHYGVQTIDEMRRRKRRRTAAVKKEEARAMREENRQRDQSAQQRAGVDWEQARIDLWRQELERREMAVRARESAVFQREEEYRRLE